MGILCVIVTIVPALMPSGTSMLAGDPRVKLVAAEAVQRTDPNNPGLDYALATAACKGLPPLSIACAATAAAYISVCVDVSGTAGGFLPVYASACASAVGAVYAGATGSVVDEQRDGTATVEGVPAPREEPIPESKRCVQPVGSPVAICRYDYRPVQDPPVVRQATCVGQNQWIPSVISDLRKDPPELPGWHVQICEGGASIIGAEYDCMTASASMRAWADSYSEDDDTSLPACQPGPQKRNADDRVDENDPCDSNGICILAAPTAQSFTTRISQLDVDEQVHLRRALRESYLTMFDSVLLQLEAGFGDDAEGDITGLRTVGFMREALIEDIDQALDGDLVVEILDLSPA
jgi:hypothetical protein